MLGNAEFYLDLCKGLIGLSPGRGNVGDDGFSRERGARGLQRGSWVTSGEKEAPLEHKCGACGGFFLYSLPGFTFVCAFQRESKNLHWLWKTSGKKKMKASGEKMKANAQELKSKSIY